MSEWPPSFGPEPQWRRPAGCPPTPSDYSLLNANSYAFQMLWRGFIPFAGGFLQQQVAPPPDCASANQQLTQSMEGILAEYEKTLTTQSVDLWVEMNRMLADVTVIGTAVANLQVLPLRNRLMYLFAGATALALLVLAVLFGI